MTKKRKLDWINALDIGFIALRDFPLNPRYKLKSKTYDSKQAFSTGERTNAYTVLPLSEDFGEGEGACPIRPPNTDAQVFPFASNQTAKVEE